MSKAHAFDHFMRISPHEIPLPSAVLFLYKNVVSIDYSTILNLLKHIYFPTILKRISIWFPAISAITLSADNSAITAAGNDFGFKFIFSRQLEAIGNPGDIVVALTTSGNSQNLIEACKVANKKKIFTTCFSGNNGGKLKKFIKLPIIIPSKNTSIIQVIELLLGQVLCEYLEQNV